MNLIRHIRTGISGPEYQDRNIRTGISRYGCRACAVTTLRGRGPRAVLLLSDFTERMAPVGAAEKAALDAFFKGKRGERVLIEQVAVALRDYFATKGTTLPELQTSRPLDPTRVQDFQEEWADVAAAAGVSDRLDARNVVRWIMEDTGTAAVVGGSRLGKAAAVADALVKKGIAVDRMAELAIATAIAEADAGDMKSQCRDVAVVWLIYTGQLPGEDERRLFSEKRMACMVEDQDPLIDVRLFKAYSKQHTTTTVPTLERALRESTGRVWQDYNAHVGRLLDESGFTHASKRWAKVVNYARKVSGGDQARERRYLQIYFFEEETGRGLPQEKCMAAALQIASADLTQPLPQLPATVPADVKMFEDQMAHQMAMMGRWAQGGEMQARYGRPDAATMAMFTPQPFAPPWALMPPPYGMPPGSPSPHTMMLGGGVQEDSGIQEVPGMPPAEQMPCLFCGGAKHVQSKCTLYIQARNAQAKATSDKVASKKAAAEAKAAERQAAAAAAAAGAGPSIQTMGPPAQP